MYIYIHTSIMYIYMNIIYIWILYTFMNIIYIYMNIIHFYEYYIYICTMYICRYLRGGTQLTGQSYPFPATPPSNRLYSMHKGWNGRNDCSRNSNSKNGSRTTALGLWRRQKARNQMFCLMHQRHVPVSNRVSQSWNQLRRKGCWWRLESNTASVNTCNHPPFGLEVFTPTPIEMSLINPLHQP
jgi:hypothetical protein